MERDQDDQLFLLEFSEAVLGIDKIAHMIIESALPGKIDM